MSISRRRFIRTGLGGLAIGLAGACTRLEPVVSPSPPPTTGRWSDPATWGGTVPSPGSNVTIDKPVVFDVDARVSHLTITPSGSLTFDPATSRELKSSGNVVVEGKLVMRPASAAVTHRLKFIGVDESRYVGGGMNVLDSDVGLWVMGAGQLDLAGTPKLAWSRSAGLIPAGTRSIELQADATGWGQSDEVAITPTQHPSVPNAHDYDSLAVTSVSGRTVNLSGACAVDHPAVYVGRGKTMTAEVLNLTRNVQIEGTPSGRAHVFIHSSSPQSISYACFRHLGPQQNGTFVLGRYALHFHHCKDGSRGSQLVGLVGRDIGAHTFVPHLSNGTTWTNCIAHDCFLDAYWWDSGDVIQNAPGDVSLDTLYDSCVASRIASDGSYCKGFLMANGSPTSNTARNCVGVGCLGGHGGAFSWDTRAAEDIWTFDDCVAHNCGAGVFVWQTTSYEHKIVRFIGYHCDVAPIRAGAYTNAYQYQDCQLVGGGETCIECEATSRDIGAGHGLEFTGSYCDAAGSEYAVRITGSPTANPDLATLFHGCDFRGASKACMGWDRATTNHRTDVVDCTFSGNEFWLDSGIATGSLVHVHDPIHGDITLRRVDGPGTLDSQWNARVQ